MAAPFIFIGTHRIKPGRLEQYRAYMRDFSRFVEEHEPQLIAFNMFLDEEGEEITIVQVHPDVRSMETHMQLVHEHIEDAYADSLEGTSGIQIYGELSDDALAMMKQLAGPGVPLTVKQEYLAGFTRSSAHPQPATA